jgi:hypothetical protein
LAISNDTLGAMPTNQGRPSTMSHSEPYNFKTVPG